MTDRYSLLLAAYAQRDHYAMMIFGLALSIVFVEYLLRTNARYQLWFRIYLLFAWVGMIIYAFLGGTL